MIDEPELHLNWALEERLFKFLRKFAINNKKQVIVSTHSRIIFSQEFKDNCVFLYFDENKLIKVTKNAPPNLLKEVSGEVIKYSLASNVKTIFVEDKRHKQALKILGKLFDNTNYNLQPLGSKTNLLAIYNAIKQDPQGGLFKESYVLIDGDGETDKDPAENRYIKLKKYSIESYFLEIKTLSKITGKTIAQIKKIMTQALNDYKKKKAKDNFLFIGDLPKSAIDLKVIENSKISKELFGRVCKKLGITEYNLMKKYFEYLHSNSKLKQHIGSKLTNFFDDNN